MACPQMHFNARQPTVEKRPVRPVVFVKITAQQLVDVAEDIAVERRGDPGTVVVGGLQNRHRLDQVDTDEQRAIVSHHRTHALEQLQ